MDKLTLWLLLVKVNTLFLVVRTRLLDFGGMMKVSAIMKELVTLEPLSSSSSLLTKNGSSQ